MKKYQDNDFINMHTHNEFSNIFGVKDSTNQNKHIIQYVANVLGQKGFAQTNHEFVGDHVKLLQEVKKLKKQGKIPQDFKVILGNEIYLVDREDLQRRRENKEPIRFYHFILLAKDEIGHSQLMELSSRAYSHFFSYRGVDRRPTYYEDIEEVVDANPGHLIASTACLGGFLGQQVMNEEYESARGFIEWCKDVFGEENFFLEMQPHLREFDEFGNEIIGEQQRVNTWIYNENAPSIITTDAHYLHEDQRILHKFYLKSDEDEETFASGGRETDSFYATTYFMHGEEIREKLNHYLDDDFITECFNNTMDIWERCEEYDLAQHVEIPQVPLPPEIQWYYNQEVIDFIYDGDYQNIIKVMTSQEPQDRYLMTMAFRGVQERKIPKYEWKETFDRLDLEMFELIGISKAKQATVSAYFVTMEALIDVFWNKAKCITGCSRGSAAGWILNYLLQIAQQNPLKQPNMMPHWRFISAERPDYPKLLGLWW